MNSDHIAEYAAGDDAGKTLNSTTTNALGGRQAYLDADPLEIPQHIMLDVARVLATGAAKYGSFNWDKIPPRDHIRHAMVHLHLYAVADKTEAGPNGEATAEMNHLLNAICRCFFAADIHRRTGGVNKHPLPPFEGE